MIASHYAEGVQRHVSAKVELHAAPASDADVVATLTAGDEFEMLDDTRGWAWGYAGKDRRVGYLPSEALAD